MRSIPTDTESLLRVLEEQYPTRCRLPNESELDHERYAGKVELLAEIRRRLDSKPTHTY